MKKKTNWAKTKRYLPLYLMLLPGAAYLIINNYLPMAGLVLAFKKVNYNVGLFQSPWTGISVHHQRCFYILPEYNSL